MYASFRFLDLLRTEILKVKYVVFSKNSLFVHPVQKNGTNVRLEMIFNLKHSYVCVTTRIFTSLNKFSYTVIWGQKWKIYKFFCKFNNRKTPWRIIFRKEFIKKKLYLIMSLIRQFLTKFPYELPVTRYQSTYWPL